MSETIMLLDKPLTRVQRDNRIDMLEGCKNRICVTDDFDELLSLLYSATYYINILAQSRYLELKERETNAKSSRNAIQKTQLEENSTEINPNK